jgi:hypothetical protein
MAMTKCAYPPGLEKVFEEVLQTAVRGATTVSADHKKRLKALADRDYEAGLNKLFLPREMRSLIKGLRLFLPSLDREQFKWNGFHDLAERASSLGAHLIARPFAGSDGMGLLGFYLREGTASKPLICVNSAHHPAAISAAFLHEVGHHLATRLLGQDDESLRYFFRPEYDKHLNEPEELLADVVVCLEAYPKSAAQQILDFVPGRASAFTTPLPSEVVARARHHLGRLFELKTLDLAAQEFHYFYGMVHFIKLRTALYRRYDL